MPFLFYMLRKLLMKFLEWGGFVMQELIAHQETINRQLARYGVKFGI